MNFNDLRKSYGVLPIPVPDEDVIIGRLVWDSPFAKPAFTRKHGYMFSHFYAAVEDAGLIDQDEALSKMEILKNMPKSDAKFPEKEITSEGHFIVDLELPMINTANAEANYQVVKSFSFSNISARLLSQKDKFEFQDYLEIIKEKNWDKYKANFRYANIITKLYYGDINFAIEKSADAKLKFEAIINKADIAANISGETERTVIYTFSDEKLPFGMYLEPLKYFTAK